MNLNHPAIDAGMLSAADLEDARRNNPGSIWHPHRHIMPHGCDGQGRHATRQWGQFPDTIATDCAPEGGTFRDPSPAMESMFRHRRIKATAGLALLLAVAGFVAQFVWPLAA